MSQFIIIPRILVHGANAQSAWWVVSGPSPLAWMGLVRKLALDMGVEDSHKIKVAIAHHDLEMNGQVFYGDLSPAQLRGNALTTTEKGVSKDYVKDGLSMGLQPVALCNLTVSLVITGLGDIDLAELENRLLFARLAGGAVQSCQSLKSCDFDEILTSVGSGFFIKDRSDLLDNVTAEQRIHQFMRQLHGAKKGDDSEKKWLAPMNLGYLPITTAIERPGSRHGILHAYAEPLIGLIEYVSKRVVSEDLLSHFFWQYDNKGAAFIVKNI